MTRNPATHPDGLVQLDPGEFGPRYNVCIATFTPDSPLEVMQIENRKIIQPELLQKWIRTCMRSPRMQFVLFWEIEIMRVQMTYLAKHICISPGSLVGEVTIMRASGPMILHPIVSQRMKVLKLPGCEDLSASRYLELTPQLAVEIPQPYHHASLEY